MKASNMNAFSGVRMWPVNTIAKAETKVAAAAVTKNAGSIVDTKMLFRKIFRISHLKGKKVDF